MTSSHDPDRNAAIVRQLITEAWTGEDLGIVDEYVSPTYVEHAPFGEIHGIDGYTEGIELFTGAFPDLEITIEDLLAVEDRVVVRLTAQGTHEGEFMGLAPTGNTVTFTAIDIARLEDGRVAEEWLAMDLLGLLQQLDAVLEGGKGDRVD